MTVRPANHFNDAFDWATQAIAAWAPTTAYVVGDLRANDTPVRIYECVVAGTSAGSGGPTGETLGIVDNTVTWNFFGVQGTAVVEPNQGTKDAGHPVRNKLPAGHWNHLMQRADQWHKHLDTRAAKGQRFPVWLTDPTPTTAAGLTLDIVQSSFITVGNEELRLGASPSISLPDASTSYVWAESDGATPPVAQLQSSVTRADMFDGAPIAIVITAGAVITSISALAPLMHDIGKVDEITVGTAGNAMFTDFPDAIRYANELNNELGGSSAPVVRLVDDITTSNQITNAMMFDGLVIDLGGNAVDFDLAGIWILFDGSRNNVTLRNGEVLLSNAAAEDVIHINAGVTITGLRIRDIQMDDTASQNAETLIESDDGILSDIRIQNCTMRGTNYGVRLQTLTGGRTITRVWIESCDITGPNSSQLAADGIDIDVTSGAADRCFVRGVQVRNAAVTGINIDADESVCSDSIVDDTGGDCFRSSGDRVRFTGCIAIDSPDSAVFAAYDMNGDRGGVVGCEAHWTNGGQTNRVAYLGSGGGDNRIIAGNNFGASTAITLAAGDRGDATTTNDPLNEN